MGYRGGGGARVAWIVGTEESSGRYRRGREGGRRRGEGGGYRRGREGGDRRGVGGRY